MAPTKKSIKLKVGAATGAPTTPAKPGPPKPPDTVTIAGQTFTMEQFKAAFDKTAADQYEAATKAILDMPAHVEMEMQKHFGVDKIGLLAHAKKFAPKSKTNLQALMAGTGKTNPTKAAVVKSANPTTMHLDQKVTPAPTKAPVQAVAPEKPVATPMPTSDALEKVHNPATNSSFYVVGALHNGLRLSIRFWLNKETPQGTGKATVKFRLRLGDQNPVGAKDYVYIENVLAFATSAYPGAGFYGTPIRNEKKELIYPHVSTEGVLIFDRKPNDQEGILQDLTSSDFVNELHDVLSKFCDTVDIGPLQLAAFVQEQIVTLLKAYGPETTVKKVQYTLGAKPRLMDSDAKKPTKKSLLADAGL